MCMWNSIIFCPPYLSVVQQSEWQKELVVRPAERDYYGYFIHKVISSDCFPWPHSTHIRSPSEFMRLTSLGVILFLSALWGKDGVGSSGAVTTMAYFKHPTIHCFERENDSNCVFIACGWSADEEIISLQFILPTLSSSAMKTNEA